MDSGNVGSVADQFADRDEASIALSCGVICPPWLPRVVHGADNPLLTNAANPKLSLAAWLGNFSSGHRIAARCSDPPTRSSSAVGVTDGSRASTQQSPCWLQAESRGDSSH